MLTSPRGPHGYRRLGVPRGRRRPKGRRRKSTSRAPPPIDELSHSAQAPEKKPKKETLNSGRTGQNSPAGRKNVGAFFRFFSSLRAALAARTALPGRRSRVLGALRCVGPRMSAASLSRFGRPRALVRRRVGGACRGCFAWLLRARAGAVRVGRLAAGRGVGLLASFAGGAAAGLVGAPAAGFAVAGAGRSRLSGGVSRGRSAVARSVPCGSGAAAPLMAAASILNT